MKKTLMLSIVVAMILVTIFSGCAASKSSEEPYYAEAEFEAEEPAAAPQEDFAEDSTENAVKDEGGLGINNASSILEPGVNRKIIYSGEIYASTKNFDEDYKSILKQLTDLGGYVENSHINGTEPKDWRDEGRSAHMTLRVPSKHFDQFVGVLRGIGTTESSSVSGRDISLEYFDTETRLKTLRIREERLQELLKQAKGLEDIIELERELADVAYEIQSNEVQLRNYDSLIDFSTITVSLREVHEVAEVTPSKESMGDRISKGFFAVLNGLADFGEGLIVFIITASPILVILGGITVLVVVLVKRSNKKQAERRKNAMQHPFNHQQGGQNDEK